MGLAQTLRCLAAEPGNLPLPLRVHGGEASFAFAVPFHPPFFSSSWHWCNEKGPVGCWFPLALSIEV
jgi:hypothetical protein